MTTHHTVTDQCAPAVLELALHDDGGMRALNWLAVVRTAASTGVRHLVLAGPNPRLHPAARALWECGTACGMQVALSTSPPSTAADRAPRIRIASDGIPRLVIPDGIPLSDLPATLLPTLAGGESPPVLAALETASAWQPDLPAAV